MSHRNGNRKSVTTKATAPSSNMATAPSNNTIQHQIESAVCATGRSQPAVTCGRMTRASDGGARGRVRRTESTRSPQAGWHWGGAGCQGSQTPGPPRSGWHRVLKVARSVWRFARPPKIPPNSSGRFVSDPYEFTPPDFAVPSQRADFARRQSGVSRTRRPRA